MTNTNTSPDNSGYHDCPCRDCFEIAIGEDDDGNANLCHDCDEHGCDGDGDSDCENPYAYGMDNVVMVKVIPSVANMNLWIAQLLSVTGEIWGATYPIVGADAALAEGKRLALADGFEIYNDE